MDTTTQSEIMFPSYGITHLIHEAMFKAEAVDVNNIQTIYKFLQFD